jgi:hypothetical protein
MSTSKRPRRFFQMPAIDQPDPEPGFQHSSEEFIIPANDEEGNSVRMQFKCPGELVGWASDIVNSKKFPFQREGDLMRYGIYLACVQLCRIDRTVPSMKAQVDAVARIVRSRENAAKITEHLDEVEKLIQKLHRQKAWGEISYILSSERRCAEETIEFEPYWGQVWVDGLHDRFAAIRAHAESYLDTKNLFPKKPPQIEEG